MTKLASFSACLCYTSSMTKTSKAIKIQVTEVIEGMTIKGNLVGGFHTVATIKTGSTQGMRNGTASEYSFLNAEGVEFFVGRVNAKAVIK